MKRIILTIGLFLSQLVVNAETNAPLILEYNCCDETKHLNIKKLENDNEFTKYFKVQITKNESIEDGVIRIIDRKSNVCLGCVYGSIPNKNFFMRLYQKELSPQYVSDIISHMTCE